MPNLKQWRIYCQTEEKYHFIWQNAEDAAPTLCPTNTADTVDESLTTEIMTYGGHETVRIEEELIHTGGRFRSESVTVDATANVISTVDSTWPYPITALGVSFVKSDIAQFRIFISSPWVVFFKLGYCIKWF